MAERHSIEDVRVQQINGKFVVSCGCGWESRPYEQVMNAAEAWQTHRDEF